MSCESYQVFWDEDALDDLANAWNQLFPDRAKTVTKAEQVIESMLSSSPSDYGKHLSEGLFKVTVSPLQVIFSVDEVKCAVHVASARLIQ